MLTFCQSRPYRHDCQTSANTCRSEDLSWSPDKKLLGKRGVDIEVNFQRSVIDFLSTGKDWPTGRVRQNVKLAELSNFFTPGFDAGAFILTPQNEKDAAQDAGAEVDGKVVYEEGLLYQPLVDKLIDAVKNVLPDRVPVTAFTYQALDGGNDDLDTTGRGKALFQYDPEARETDGVVRRGARLIFEGINIEITDPRPMTFLKGVVYEKYWDQDNNGVNEDRLLSSPESQASDSDQQGSSLSCGNQVYGSNDYTCDGNTLCPVLDGIRTLLCGTQCYLESHYTCYDSFLCPVMDGVPTLRCGEDCYLPSQYKCVILLFIELYRLTILADVNLRISCSCHLQMMIHTSLQVRPLLRVRHPLHQRPRGHKYCSMELCTQSSTNPRHSSVMEQS